MVASRQIGGERLLVVILSSLLLSACSSHKKSDLWGTWQAAIAFPQEQADAVRARLPEDVSVSISDINMILTIDRDEQFRLTNDCEVSYVVRSEAVAWVRNVRVRQEMAGSWNFVFAHLDLSVREASAEPLDESTARIFEENPDLRQSWTPDTQGLFDALRFEVEEIDPNELVLSDPVYGRIRFTRF